MIKIRPYPFDLTELECHEESCLLCKHIDVYDLPEGGTGAHFCMNEEDENKSDDINFPFVIKMDCFEPKLKI